MRCLGMCLQNPDGWNEQQFSRTRVRIVLSRVLYDVRIISRNVLLTIC
jgi:hypothetical protein